MSQFLWVGNSGAAQWGSSGSGSLTRWPSGCQSGLLLFEGLTRAEWASFKMAHSTWLLARGSDFLVTVPGVLTSSPHRTFLGTCRVFTHHGIWLPPEWTTQKTKAAFCDLALKIIHCHTLFEGSYQFNSHSRRQKSNFIPGGHCITDFMSIFLKPS